MIFEYAVKTGRGRVRINNEDNFCINELVKEKDLDEYFLSGKSEFENALFAVSDGMGGEEAGEVASFLTVTNAFSNWQGEPVEFVRELNRIVLEEAHRLGVTRMGSTLSFLGVTKEQLILANVGDSRNYLIRGGEIFRTSKDHSKAQMLIEMGLMTEQEAKASNAWHILMQNLGVSEEEILLEPWVTELMYETGDVFVLCSDGFSDYISEENILEVICQESTLEEKVSQFYEMAYEAGGRDNITVMLIRCL